MSDINFSHAHSLTICGLKKLASGVLPETWKVLAERLRRSRTKNNKSPVTRGDLIIKTCTKHLELPEQMIKHIQDALNYRNKYPKKGVVTP